MTGTPTQNAVHVIRKAAGNPHRHPETRQALLAIADVAGVAQVETLPFPAEARADDDFRPPCRDCGPGYRIGDEGCRHTRDEDPPVGQSLADAGEALAAAGGES